MNAEELLNVANETSIAFQATLSETERTAIAASDTPASAHSTFDSEDALLQFAADGLAELLSEMQAIMDQRREKLYREALEVYYAAEELSRDPAHAHLIPHVEAMRRGHERDFGRGIPERVG